MIKKNGFTLIEVLIVIVIVGILAGALVPRVSSAKDGANDSVRISYAQGVSSSVMQYYIDHQDYPEIDENVKIGNCNCATLSDGLGDTLLPYGYGKDALPRDPVAGSSFRFCGADVPNGQFVYCKMDDGLLFISHLQRHGGNANLADFENKEITENTKRSEIEAMLTTDGGDLYIYHGG